MWPDQAGIVEHAVDAGQTDRDYISIEHHEGKSTVAFQGMPGVEVEDGFFLLAWMPTEGKLANTSAGRGLENLEDSVLCRLGLLCAAWNDR